ncbi:unnamed protein product [Cylindrotheca closterium]|uniref:Uncharacterized protein n=1 Tax=Cylindrotheca closterium TaxID=2856 RepID=A0AAD2CVS3_9STRA|nr:unnamed protein product [Cylindrotheca closterium]
MQTTLKTKIFEHNNAFYTTDFSESSDYYDEASSRSLASQDPTTTSTVPPTTSPFRIGDFITSPISPGRNIDRMMMQQTKITKYDNRRTLLQRFKSISRKRKVNMSKDEEPLLVALPLEDNHSVVPDEKGGQATPGGSSQQEQQEDEEKPLSVLALPLEEEDNNHRIVPLEKPPAPAASPATPWEKYSKKNYFRGVFSS